MTEYTSETAPRAESTLRWGPARRGGVLGLGLAGAVASVLPVIGVNTWLGVSEDGILLLVSRAVVVVGLLVAVPVMLLVLHEVRRSWPRYAKTVLACVLLADMGVMLLLTVVLPFRWGLLSCLMYCLPALFVACATILRSRASVQAAVAGLLLVYVLAIPVRELQQHVAAKEWLRATGIPSRAMAQVVTLPGMTQEPYTWDGKTLTAMFDLPMGPSQAWMGAERVTSGYVDPCGPLLEGAGDASETESPPCAQDRPGLWFRGTSDDVVGYVLQRDGVTISLTGGVWPRAGESDVEYAAKRRAALRQVILAAHPATDAELWSREGSTKPTLVGLLLL
ncbi:hypothetical protein [Streptomyces sp. NPDC003710]